MKIFLTGKNGQLGYQLEHDLKRTHELIATDRSTLDLINFQLIEDAVFKVKPDLIINAAAYTSVDKAEKVKDLAYQVNALAPKLLTKAASDHLIRAWFQTYKLPVLTVNSTNNYGPYQFPEKLIPLCILNALNDKPLPIYGDGQHIRDWVYVKDHCYAIREVLGRGQPGETYNVGGWNEKTNLEVVKTLCGILDELKPKADGLKYESQITYVKDRPGHDRRYAIDASKLERELGWRPQETFETGLRKTILWYLENETWVNHVVSGEYQHWVQKQYS